MQLRQWQSSLKVAPAFLPLLSVVSPVTRPRLKYSTSRLVKFSNLI